MLCVICYVFGKGNGCVVIICGYVFVKGGDFMWDIVGYDSDGVVINFCWNGF